MITICLVTIPTNRTLYRTRSLQPSTGHAAEHQGGPYETPKPAEGSAAALGHRQDTAGQALRLVALRGRQDRARAEQVAPGRQVVRDPRNAVRGLAGRPGRPDLDRRR